MKFLFNIKKKKMETKNPNQMIKLLLSLLDLESDNKGVMRLFFGLPFRKKNNTMAKRRYKIKTAAIFTRSVNFVTSLPICTFSTF